MRIPERDKREKEVERKFNEILAQNFQNFMKYINPHTQESQHTQRSINKRSMARYIIIKL